MQKDPKTSFMRPVYFASRVMTLAERDYTQSEQMVLALMFVVSKFRPYLLPRRFSVVTTEETFPFVLQHMEVSPRIAKWVVCLQEFDYTFMVESSTRACLADILTQRCYEKKPKVKNNEPILKPPSRELEGAYSLYFDGAFKRKSGIAGAGIVILHPDKSKLLEKGERLEGVFSNNEAEYAALALGLRACIEQGVQRVNVFGDSMLLVRQIQGTWACKSSSLATRLREVRGLMRQFEAIQVSHVPRNENEEADKIAEKSLEVAFVGMTSLQEAKFEGCESLEEVLQFIETGEFLPHVPRNQRRWLARKAIKYNVVNGTLYCKGKDGILRRVPSEEEIESILESCHEGVCGGHFAHDITSRKILQSGFIWPSLHRDVQNWCKTCDDCQRTGPRRLFAKTLCRDSDTYQGVWSI